jgi:hypothetical protein
MAIKFATKDDPKGTSTPFVPPTKTARASVELSSGEGSVGATDETPVSSAVGADLFSAEPAASPRKRRKK